MAFESGIKYLGFQLKPNNCQKKDYQWLLVKLEKQLQVWIHKWLSRARRLMLVKSVLEAILAYWMSLSWIPKENPGAYPLTLLLFPLELEQGPFHYALGSLGKNCDFKGAGRLGLKNIFHFSKALAAKCVCRLLKTTNLLTSII